MEFGILGPLTVWSDGSEVPVGAGRQRALLSLLLLRRGQVVSADRLIDELWGARPPATARKALSVHISQLRKQLGPGVIETRAGGYVLRARDGTVDADRFERAFAAGRDLAAAGQPRAAEGEFSSALALWRGVPLPELRDEEFARPEIARLSELRLVALEYRLEAELELGLQAEVVPEVEALVREYPLRESLRRLQMLALYRCGRQADALAAYRDARRVLVDELGLEPGEELQRLEAEILRHDPGLSASRPVPTPTVQPRRARPRRPVLLACAAAALVASAAAGVIVAERGGAGVNGTAAGGDSVAVFGLGGSRSHAPIPLGANPSAIVATGGALWVANVDAATVSRVDPSRGTTVQTIPVGEGPDAVAARGRFVWVSNGLSGTVTKIDPGVDRVVDTIDVGNEPAALVAGRDGVWVAGSSDGTVTRIDAATDRAEPPVAVAGSADGIALGFGSVWVTSEEDGTVTRLDGRTGAVIRRIDTGGGAAAVTTGLGSVWVANSLDGTVTRIDPGTDTVRAVIPAGDGPDGIAIAGGAVWVANELSGTLTKLDPRTGESVRTITLGNRPEALAVDGPKLFVALRSSGGGHRGGTLRVLSLAGYLDAIDPAVASSMHTWQLLSLTNDGLTGFRRTGGSAGTRLVPDLALSLPAPTDGGLTYSFRLRPGLRYSTGETVRAGDIRRGIERALTVPEGAGAYMGAILGAQQCLAAPQRPCDLSRGIAVDQSTITFHLSRPDPAFLYELALPPAYAVPRGFPIRASRPVPATGPYEVASFDSKLGVRLVRNPSFHEWSPAAQPRGYPDVIVERLRSSADASVKAVLAGAADVAAGSLVPSAALLRSLRTQHAGLLHVDPWTITFALVLDTRAAPFADVRVRRALSYAIDRQRLADLAYAPGLAAVTCQVLPPNFDGYRRYCPYTSDLARARELVRESHTTGQHVTVSVPAWFPFGSRVGRYVVSVLDRLGYHARLRESANPYAPAAVGRLQLGLTGWLPNFAAAADFFEQDLTCRSARVDRADNAAAFCDPAVDREIARAQELEVTDPAHAALLWARVDRDVVDQAPWVPFANGVSVAVVSRRVGDYQYSPQWGPLLDQLWVR